MEKQMLQTENNGGCRVLGVAHTTVIRPAGHLHR